MSWIQGFTRVKVDMIVITKLVLTIVNVSHCHGSVNSFRQSVLEVVSVTTDKSHTLTEQVDEMKKMTGDLVWSIFLSIYEF